MIFTDDDLKIFKGMQEISSDEGNEFRDAKIRALLARLEASERRECNQFHCGHVSCNEWRKAAGK